MRYEQETQQEEPLRNLWAKGCGMCTNGLVHPPDASRFHAPLYLVRWMQFSTERLTFCDCEAGRLYHQRMMNVDRDVENGTDFLTDGYRESFREQVIMPTVHFVMAGAR